MSNEQLKQRIKYLAEHGGLWDDPIGDIRRNVRWAVGLGVVVMLLVLGRYLVA